MTLTLIRDETKIMSEFTHAGGIVFKTDDDVCRYLIVSAKKNPDHWVFPKGHVDSEETPEATAVREVLEETGVEARILEIVGSTKFKTKEETVYVEFYLMEYLSDGERAEPRQQRWCTYKEGLELLTFEDARQLLSLSQSMSTNFIRK